MDLPPRSGRLINRKALLPAVLLLAAVWGMAGFLAFVPLYARDLGLPSSGWLLFLFAAVVVAIRSLGARLPDRLGAARHPNGPFRYGRTGDHRSVALDARSRQRHDHLPLGSPWPRPRS